MKRKVGLWIDHRKAVIVLLAGEEEEMKMVLVRQKVSSKNISSEKGSVDV
jgi:hypothetical protein